MELHRAADSVFADDVVIENSLGDPIHYATERVYSGALSDTPSSSVHGIVGADGQFDGHISTPSEHYYVEPAKR